MGSVQLGKTPAHRALPLLTRTPLARTVPVVVVETDNKGSDSDCHREGLPLLSTTAPGLIHVWLYSLTYYCFPPFKILIVCVGMCI